MPSINDVFGGSTLRSEDIQGKNPTVIIESVEPREFTGRDGKTKQKLLITFHKASKALVCNSTNAHIIAQLYGDDYTTWTGQKIKLGVHMTPMGPGICVQNPNGEIKTVRAAPKPPKQTTTRVYNDTDMEPSEDIPF